MKRVTPRQDIHGIANLSGKYRLIAELGQGGMATVYLAVVMGTSGFRKLAVVKLLRPEIASEADYVQMFLDEARLCARLNHPNIVHTYDVGVDEYGYLMAMEYLDGVSLHAGVSKMRKAGRALPFAVQGRVLLDVLEGLRYAHNLKDYSGSSLDIVHRDVSPQNIFVTFDGQVKLLDFGIAKAATSSVHTAAGVIKGKLTFMAPEQARGDAIDARADLYAVGVMLWEAVTGRRRFPAGLSQAALFTKLARGDAPEPPDCAARGCPPELDAIILKALSPNPDDRYQTADDFHKALERVLHACEPVSLRDVGAMLADEFSDARERMRGIIEEQFQIMDAGGAASGPHQVPAVIPPSRITGTHTFGSTVAMIDRQAVPVTTAIPAAIPSHAPSAQVRTSRTTQITLTLSGLFFLSALAIVSLKSSTSMGPPTPTPPTRVTNAASSAVAAHDQPPSVASPPDIAPDPPTSDAIRVTGTSTPSPTSAPPGKVPPNRSKATPTPSARASAAISPTAALSPSATVPPAVTAAPTASADQPPPSRGKVKVLLERDNPWP